MTGPNATLTRSTHECETMNIVYDMLKTLDIDQLHEFKNHALVHGGTVDDNALLLHQVDVAIQRKTNGRW